MLKIVFLSLQSWIVFVYEARGSWHSSGVWTVCLESSNGFCHLEIKGYKAPNLEEPEVTAIPAGRRGDYRNDSEPLCGPWLPSHLSNWPHCGKPHILKEVIQKGQWFQTGTLCLVLAKSF